MPANLPKGSKIQPLSFQCFQVRYVIEMNYLFFVEGDLAVYELCEI